MHNTKPAHAHTHTHTHTHTQTHTHAYQASLLLLAKRQKWMIEITTSTTKAIKILNVGFMKWDSKSSLLVEAYKDSLEAIRKGTAIMQRRINE